MDQLLELVGQIVSLAKSHAWVALASVLIGIVIRLSKDDKFAAWCPLNIPPKYRAWAALGGGVVVGVLDALVAGQKLVPAIVNGLVAAMIAISSHQAVIEGARDGRELFAPKRAANVIDLSSEALSNAPPPPPPSSAA